MSNRSNIHPMSVTDCLDGCLCETHSALLLTSSGTTESYLWSSFILLVSCASVCPVLAPGHGEPINITCRSHIVTYCSRVHLTTAWREIGRVVVHQYQKRHQWSAFRKLGSLSNSGSGVLFLTDTAAETEEARMERMAQSRSEAGRWTGGMADCDSLW